MQVQINTDRNIDGDEALIEPTGGERGQGGAGAVQ